MKKSYNKSKGITLVALIVTVITLLILVGIAIAQLTGSGILEKAKLAKNKYEISDAKEKIEFAIADLRIEYEGKGENLTKEALPKLNSEEIDVGSVENFPVEVIYGKYKFNVDENFIVTYVGEADGTIVTYTTEPEGYTNQDEIEILIKVSNSKGIKTIEYPDGDVLELGGATERGLDYKVTANGTYTFKVTDSENNEVIKDIVIDQIDKLDPLDFTPEVKNDNGTITITENAQDAEADGISTKSGIAYYEYYIIDKNNVTTKYEKNQIDLALGTYKAYVIAYDRAGNNKKSNEVEFKISIQFSYISAGYKYSLGIDREGNLWAWGRNNDGQLGDGTTTDRYSPVQIKSETKFSQVSLLTLGTSSFGIDREGNLWAWGSNYQGRLGDGTTTDRYSPVPIKSGTKFSQVSEGMNHNLAIDREGNLWAWGYNNYGQLGNGTTAIYSPSLVAIKSETKFRKVSLGQYHSLAIDSEGNLWTWGANGNGELGDGTRTNRYSPVPIKSGTKFSQVSAGTSHSLAIDSQGNLWAWGSNYYGELGDGTKTDSYSPVPIKSGVKFSQIWSMNNSCFGIDSEGNLWAWGYNNYGQLGDGTTTDSTSPVLIKSGTKFSKIALGEKHCLAIDTEGNLWAWGYGVGGLLGDGENANRTSPVPIKSGTKFSQITAGSTQSFAIDNEGNTWAWGSNINGELGDGTTTTRYSPVQI